MNEDATALRELHEITDEVRRESKAERRERLVREFFERAHDAGTANPDEILPLIEKELVDNYLQYPSLLNLFDGNEERAAVKVRDHMMECESFGRTTGIKMGIMDLERIAAAAILCPVP